jgi:hypothetical protein
MRLGLVAIQMLLLVVVLHAQDPLSAFVAGPVLEHLRSTASLKAALPENGNPALIPAVSSAAAIAADVNRLGPTVGAELLQIIPGPGPSMDTPAGLLALYNALHAVSTMKGVTYWSVTRGREMVLFLQSYVIASPEKPDRVPDLLFDEIPGEHDLFTFQEDSSFGKNTYEEHFSARTDHLLVKTENLSTIAFLLIPIIQPHGLVSQVVAVPAGKDVLFYGLAYMRSGFPIGDKSSRVQSLENRLAALGSWLAKRISLIDAAAVSPAAVSPAAVSP